MISSSLALKMGQSDFGTVITIALRQDVLLHQLLKDHMLGVCNQSVQYLLMKLFLVDGLMDTFVLIVWITVNFFGKLIMHTKAA